MKTDSSFDLSCQAILDNLKNGDDIIRVWLCSLCRSWSCPLPCFDEKAPEWCPYNIRRPEFLLTEVGNKELLETFNKN